MITRGNSFITGSTFKNNTIGIKITGGSQRIENNTFQENDTPIFLGDGSSPVFSNNSAQNNGLNGISVDSDSIIVDTIWQSNLPYILGSKSVATGVTLTLKEGTVVKSNGYLVVYGRLITEGTLTNPVVFTSVADDEYGGDTNNNSTSTLAAKGNWQQLMFQSSATSTLEGVKVRYGGGGCSMGFCQVTVNLVSGGLEIKNSVIEKNVWGIYSGAGSCPTAFETLKLTNVVFSENDKDIVIPYDTCSPL